MSKASEISGVTTNLVNLLEPLDALDRQKVIKAAMTLLGDAAELSKPHISAETDHGDDSASSYPARAKSWMAMYQLTEDQLCRVFHIEGQEAEIIASDMPGKSAREKTINAYVLTGILNLLKSGDGKFDDETARAFCKKAGIFDTGNHSKYLSAKGNVLGGSKTNGWSLTTPGLKAGAELVKEITST